jgi:lysozyme
MGDNKNRKPERKKDQAAWLLEKKKLSAANSKPGTKPSPQDRGIPTVPLSSVDCVNGIDFSSGCGPVDWYQLADNPQLDFVYFRCSINKYTDSQFKNNLAGALNIWKKPFGIYHFYYAPGNTKEQVDILARYDADGPNLPSWWDAELSYGKTKQYLGNEQEKAMKYALDKYNLFPTIYTSPGWWNSCMPRTNWAKWHDLAVAQWSRTMLLPELPQDWVLNMLPLAKQRREGWLFWQWHNKGRVPGINASVDLIRCPRSKFEKLVKNS